MENLAKALTSAINSGNLPKSIEQKAVSLLNDISNHISLFVKEESKWDAVRVRALRIDMAFNFATGEWYSVRKRLNAYDPSFNFYLSSHASKYCSGCHYYEQRGFNGTKWDFCANPCNKCPREIGKRDRAKSILIKWLFLHESTLIDATKEYNKQLLYIAQNATQRYKGICGELYKTIQCELIQELKNYKLFIILCNQLTPNHY